LQANKLHIVAFDVPYPADYGGTIDVFYKIKNLKEAGAQVYLHCFQYGRKRSKELESLCTHVWYYPRKTGIGGISITLPYIVYSRRNKQLLKNMASIDAPILFEGIHTTYNLSHPALKDRFKAIRIHNIEHEYYAELYKKESHFLKRRFFKTESQRLKKYEQNLQNAQALFPLSIADAEYFRKLYPNKICEFIAPFQPFNEVTSIAGKGKYCLYHGNLSHPENKEAVFFLLKEVIPYTDMQFIITGKEPSDDLFNACKNLANCRLITNPSTHEMEQLIQNAQIHALPTFQATGMKLKLLYALFSGRHVLANSTMLHGTGLEACCIMANDANSFLQKIEEYSVKPFTEQDIAARREKLQQHYSNKANAARLITYLLH
jgi:hypothetical protein